MESLAHFLPRGENENILVIFCFVAIWFLRGEAVTSRTPAWHAHAFSLSKRSNILAQTEFRFTIQANHAAQDVEHTRRLYIILFRYWNFIATVKTKELCVSRTAWRGLDLNISLLAAYTKFIRQIRALATTSLAFVSSTKRTTWILREYLYRNWSWIICFYTYQSKHIVVE